MQPFAKRFYRSKAWQRTRNAYFIARHGLCERCGRPGLIVHHRIILTPDNINDPTVTLNWSNLELVCQTCHNTEHMGSDFIRENLMFDADGNVIPRVCPPPKTGPVNTRRP